MLLHQAKKFKVKNIIITDLKNYLKIKKLNKDKNINIYQDFKDLNNILNKKIDYSMSSIMGLDGLLPTIKIVKFTKNIAVVNKESLICGWDLIKKEIKKYKTNFVPIDSEHFSIYTLIKNYKISDIERIYITASGGPFINLPKKNFKSIKLKQALKHPNWKMGNKITIDSSTLMNKVFEVIEAKNIFNLNLDKISILIHPKSYIHALISFNDGMIKIIAHETTMDIPILNSLFNERNQIIKTKVLN